MASSKETKQRQISMKKREKRQARGNIHATSERSIDIGNKDIASRDHLKVTLLVIENGRLN